MSKQGKRGGWQSGYYIEPIAPAQPTKFELLIAKVGAFTLEEQLKSPRIRDFVRRYYRSRYVPEELLKHMDLGRLIWEDTGL